MTSRRAGSLAAIARVARSLGDALPDVLFVGGTATACYPLAGGVDVRSTIDVDVVVDVTSAFAYHAFVEPLRQRGFQTCVDEGAPLCRLVCAGVRVDVMASGGNALGFSNRGYPDVCASASLRGRAGLEVRVIAPVDFVATKLEAFADRGSGDFADSHEIEDVMAVLAGLSDLRSRIVAAAEIVERHVRDVLRDLARNESFIDACYGHFEGDPAGQQRPAHVVA